MKHYCCRKDGRSQESKTGSPELVKNKRGLVSGIRFFPAKTTLEAKTQRSFDFTNTYSMSFFSPNSCSPYLFLKTSLTLKHSQSASLMKNSENISQSTVTSISAGD